MEITTFNPAARGRGRNTGHTHRKPAKQGKVIQKTIGNRNLRKKSDRVRKNARAERATEVVNATFMVRSFAGIRILLYLKVFGGHFGKRGKKTAVA